MQPKLHGQEKLTRLIELLFAGKQTRPGANDHVMSESVTGDSLAPKLLIFLQLIG
jgi:hypothetical protein